MTTWIFQGNPKRFKVDDYLRENQNIVWSIRQEYYVANVQVGDTVYIWRSEAGKKGYGGIVAKTVVTGESVLRKDVTSSYWVTPSDANEILPRVPLLIKELALDNNHLTRDQLKNDKVLSNLTILKMSNNTNYRLFEMQAMELDRLWQQQVVQNNKAIFDIPLPEPVKRSREYLQCSEEERSNIVYEYLMNGNSHRWIDENVLKLDVEYSRGYQAMGVLHHLGMKNNFKGLFKGLSVSEALGLLENEILEAIINDPLYRPIIEVLSKRAVSKVEYVDTNHPSNDINESKEYPEGKIAYLLHRKRERSLSVVKDAKARFIKKHGKLFCEACEFDFTAFYGDRGNDFIEGHHIKLVSQMKEGDKTKVEDIAMLCSNCHRMIHRKPLISVEGLKVTITKRKK